MKIRLNEFSSKRSVYQKKLMSKVKFHHQMRSQARVVKFIDVRWCTLVHQRHLTIYIVNKSKYLRISSIINSNLRRITSSNKQNPARILKLITFNYYRTVPKRSKNEVSVLEASRL